MLFQESGYTLSITHFRVYLTYDYPCLDSIDDEGGEVRSCGTNEACCPAYLG